jgi:FixJ family two-component response regulator
LDLLRSQLFWGAAAEFLQRRENQALLEAINRACDDSSDTDAERHRQAMRLKQRLLLKEEW